MGTELMLAVLRCSRRYTFEADKWLRENGIDSFTPIKTINKRLPRSKRRIEFSLPLFPGWVFVDDDQWNYFNKARLEAVPRLRIHQFQFMDCPVSIEERAIAHLYNVDETVVPKEGDIASICDGAFAGRIGEVLSISRSGIARLDLDGSIVVLPIYNLLVARRLNKNAISKRR
jgi:hypothetical protein